MENLYKIKEAVYHALSTTDTVRSGELNIGELEFLRLATDTIKNIEKICMLKDEGGYSQGGDWEADMRGSYGRGSSYVNPSEHWVRGHYSRDDGSTRDMGGGGYSSRRDNQGGYSQDGGRTAMMEHLEAALNSASEQDRENIKRFMREMDRV